MDTETYLEDLEAIVDVTPYWMKEVHGKYLIQRLRKFIIENGGDKSRVKPNKNGIARSNLA